jgi:hypothetical protein
MNRLARHAAFTLAAIASAVATTTAVRAETVFNLTTDFVFCQDVFPPPQPGLPPVPGGGICTPSPESPAGVGEFPWVDRTYWRTVLYYYSFTYSDDGQPRGDSTFESATLSFTPQQAGVSYQINVLGAPADAFSIVSGPALVLGNNDHPDSFSGTIRVDVTRGGATPGVSFGGITPVLSIDSAPDGGITPVPEPSTYALMMAGLGVLGWKTRQRRREGRLDSAQSRRQRFQIGREQL